MSIRLRRWEFWLVLASAMPHFWMSGSTATAQVTGDAARTSQPLSPAEAQASFQLPADLEIELVAAEPQVIDPVAIRFSEDGSLWVVEMRDYPHGPAPGEPPLSRIRRLRDEDGDGRFETSQVFAESLLFPTGIQPWKGGLIVTLAGRVNFMIDQDGDGKADRTETWFEGFAEENSQLRANHPTLALDNHVYIANGLRGGDVRDVRRPDAPVTSIRNRDFRFDPLGTQYEAVSGLGQFGLTLDNFGRRFVCSNRNPARHVVLEDRYLARSPDVPVSEVVHDVAAYAEHSRLFPLSRAWTTSTLHANQFTAACGVHVFRGDGLPDDYRLNVYTCDPTGNLVHREIMRPKGATFQGTPAYKDHEFLATRDEWFRPVNLEVGPDGALYVVDMYRAVIEHPQFMPDELKNRPDLRLGDDRGRIWRIRAKGPRAPMRLVESSTTSQLEALQDSNAWRRETASRLLLERQDRSVVPALRELAHTAPPAPSRAIALWLLEGLHALDAQTVRQALHDSDPGVREQAIILSERWRDDPAWRDAIVAMSEDPDSRVRFQVALWLIPAASDREIEALARIALAAPGDPWTRRAVLLASSARTDMLAQQVWREWAKSTPHEDDVPLARELASVAGRLSEPSVAMPAALEKLGHSPTRRRAMRAALAALLQSWQVRRVDWRALAGQQPELKASLETILREADADALRRDLTLEERGEALDLARFAPEAKSIGELALRRNEDASLRAKAIGLATRISEPAFWKELLERFPAESPAVRSAIFGAALGRTEATSLLLEAMEAGRIRPQEISANDFARLERHADPHVRERAAKLAAARTPEDRKLALARFEPCLSLKGDPLRGRKLFAKTCAACHRIGDLGVDVAPDIADSRTKTPQQLLGDILQPNRAIDGNYIAYVVQTTDGRTLTGIISAETATSITLRQQENKTETLARGDIEVIQSTGRSLMPEGLEQDMTLQDMADLISFIKNWRYLDGRTPLAQ